MLVKYGSLIWWWFLDHLAAGRHWSDEFEMVDDRTKEVMQLVCERSGGRGAGGAWDLWWFVVVSDGNS